MAFKEGVAEALNRISKLKTKEEKIAALRKDHSLAMETIVNCCFNPNIRFLLPEGKPPYKPQPKESDCQGTLYANLRKFRIFVNNPDYENMKQLQRENQFIQFLESLDPDDATMVVSIKDKKMPFKGITKKLFEDAWPALASTWVDRTENV